MEDEKAPNKPMEPTPWQPFDETTTQVPGKMGKSGFIALLLMGLLLIFAALDPFELLMFSGLLTASALMVSRRLPRSLVNVVLLFTSIAGFVMGGPVTGVVVSSALIVAVTYPAFQTRFRREDAHFFLASFLFWFCIGIGAAIAFIMNRNGFMVMKDAIEQACRQLLQQWMESRKAMLGPEEVPLPQFVWLQAHPMQALVCFVLIVQSISSYLAIKWVRGRLNWTHPIWSRFILFRLSVHYSFILVIGLLLLILTPEGSRGGWVGTVPVPLLIWFGSGCLLAGLACSSFMVVSLRLGGRIVLARLHQGAIVLMVLFAPWILALVGLVDIWFDMRKQNITKSMSIGKGDS